MKERWLVSWLPWVGIVLLVAVLGILQHRWLGEVVRSENERLSIVVHAVSRHAADEFDRELSRVFLHFQPSSEAAKRQSIDAEYSDALASWKQSASEPDLVRSVYWIRRQPDASHELLELDSSTHGFSARPWPERLRGVKKLLEEPILEHLPDGHESKVSVSFPVLPKLPGLMIPLAYLLHGSEKAQDPGGSDGDNFETHIADLLASVLVVELDLDHLRAVLLPNLLERYRLGMESDYEVVVRVRETGDLIYSSTSVDPAELEFAARTPLFGLRPPAELRSMWVEMYSRGMSRRESAGLNLATIIIAIGGDESGWELAVAHREGSLEAVVAKNQRRLLWIIGGLLAVLFLAFAALNLSNRRAQALARQQVEFVAGVSHELRTPLASIKLLAQNLSRGVVGDEAQVKKYGTMIEREEVRLTTMVEQVLGFSGAISSRDTLSLKECDLGDIVGRAVDSIRSAVGQAGKELILEIPSGRTSIRADADALARAVENLLSNAIKYGADSRRIEVRIATDSRVGRARVSVEDQGPGIAREDLPRLFEPFYRSEKAKSSQLPGSGLGLSFVRHVAEAHGGRVWVESQSGEGTRFCIEIPWVEEAAS